MASSAKRGAKRQRMTLSAHRAARERGRRQREERLDWPIHLTCDGERAVVARAGLGRDAVGNFTLHHQGCAFDGCGAGGEFEQDWAR